MWHRLGQLAEPLDLGHRKRSIADMHHAHSNWQTHSEPSRAEPDQGLDLRMARGRDFAGLGAGMAADQMDRRSCLAHIGMARDSLNCPEHQIELAAEGQEVDLELDVEATGSPGRLGFRLVQWQSVARDSEAEEMLEGPMESRLVVEF